MREHTYAPPTLAVLAPGDGNRVLVGSWPGGLDVVAVVMTEEVAKEVGRQLLAPSVAVATELPPGMRGGI